MSIITEFQSDWFRVTSETNQKVALQSPSIHVSSSSQCRKHPPQSAVPSIGTSPSVLRVRAASAFLYIFRFGDYSQIYLEYTKGFPMEQDEQVKHLRPTADYGERFRLTLTTHKSFLEQRWRRQMSFRGVRRKGWSPALEAPPQNSTSLCPVTCYSALPVPMWNCMLPRRI